MTEVLNLDPEELVYQSSRFVERGEVSRVVDLLGDIHRDKIDIRAIPIECESGTGKTWLLRHLAEVEIAPPSRQPSSVGRYLEHMYGHSIYLDLQDWLDIGDEHIETAALVAATRLIASIGRQVDTWSDESSDPWPDSPESEDIDSVSIRLEERVRHLVLGPRPDRPLFVLFVDHVYEAPWDFLRVLDGKLFGPLAAIPRVVLVIAGRGLGFPWQSPNMWLQRSDPIRLHPLTLDQTCLLLDKLDPPYSGNAKSVFNFSDGYPRRTYLIASRGRSIGIKTEVVSLLSFVPEESRAQIHAYLKALCVLESFDEDSIPRMLNVYNEFMINLGKGTAAEVQATKVRQALVEYGFAIWSDEYRGWVIDRAVQSAIMVDLGVNQMARLLVKLDMCAHDLYLERERKHPATAKLWSEAARSIRDESLSSGWQIPELIGRKYKYAKEAIDKAIAGQGTSIIYLTASGGMGKTRVLNDSINRWRTTKQTPDGRSLSIVDNPIDLYHVEAKNVDGLINVIITALEHQGVDFSGYERAQQELSETSSKEGSAKERRALRTQMRNLFIEALNSWDNRLVLAFDTAESLDYGINRDVVKQLKIKPEDQYGTRPWMVASLLPKLQNAVVLIAGRKNEPDLENDLRAIPNVAFVPIDLDWDSKGDEAAKIEFVEQYFTEVADALHEQAREGGVRYAANAHRVRAWSEEWEQNPSGLEMFTKLTQGNPIVLGLAIDYLVTTDEWQPAQYALPDQQIDALEFNKRLAKACAEKGRIASDAILALAYLRKGADANLLLQVMEARGQKGFVLEQARASVESLRKLTFVKTRSGDVDPYLFLHDLVYDLLERYVLGEDEYEWHAQVDNITVSDVVLNAVHDYYDERIKTVTDKLTPDTDNSKLVEDPEQYRSKLMANLEQYRVESLYYHLHQALHSPDDPLQSFDIFYQYADTAVQGEMEGLLVDLNSELRTWQKNNKHRLPDALINADDAIRWVKWFIACDAWDKAVEAAKIVREHYVSKVASTSEKHLFARELAVWDAKAHLHLGKLDTASAFLKHAKGHRRKADVVEFKWKWRQTSVEAHMHNTQGYFDRIEGRYYSAIAEYSKAVPLWRALEYNSEQSNSLNNLAFAHGEVGDFDTARRQAEDALVLRVREATYPPQVLSLNTLSQIAMREGLYVTAQRYAEQALKLNQERTRDERGRGLALVARAEALRRWATEKPMSLADTRAGQIVGEQNTDEPITLLRRAISDAREACGIFEDIGESHSHIEALIQLGCAQRDLMDYLGDPDKKPETLVLTEEHIEELSNCFEGAVEAFTQARIKAVEAGIWFLAIDACNRTAWHYYYRGNHYRKGLDHVLAGEHRKLAVKALDDADQLIADYYGMYQGLGSSESMRGQKRSWVIPLIAQIGKSEVLRGQMAFGEYKDLMKSSRNDRQYTERSAATAVELNQALIKAIKHYARSLNCDGMIDGQFRDKRRAHDRIYDQLKNLNMDEWSVVFNTLDSLKNRIPVEKTRRFLLDNFGDVQWAHGMYSGKKDEK